jgi:uncharacterized membrane-anchored protein YjiN (DUF445 family)
MLERTRPIPTPDVERKRTQRQAKSALATGLLLIAVAIFFGLRFVSNPGFFVRLLSAAAEAAIVGGLADWFAITALFRRPLGLPIPHTALIPSRKDEIGRSLGNFVRDQFLEPELLTERLRRQNRALQIAQWLDTEEAADFFAERAVILVPPLLQGLNDTEVRTFLARLAQSGLTRLDLVPMADALLDDFVRAGRHLQLLDALASVLRPSMRALKEPIIERVGERTGRFFPRYFDRKIGQGIVDGAESWLEAICTPGNEERSRLDSWLKQTIAEFRNSPDYPKLLEEAQSAIASNPAVLEALSSIWDEIKREWLADTGKPSPKTAIIAREIVRTFGRLMQQSPVIQDYLNAAIEQLVVHYVTPWRIQIGNYIADVIKGWDGPKVAETIELQVGADLQYIRINGTLVGGLVGLLIYAVSQWIAQF